jgi:serine protease Do
MITKRTQLLLVILVFIILLPAGAGGEDAFRLYPLPLVELNKVLSRWMQENAFSVSQSGPAAGPIQMSGIRGSERWQMVLQSHSPLFSSLEAEYRVNGRENPRKLRELWVFLDDYLAKGAPVAEKKDREMPPFLLQIDAMVCCIKAVSGSQPIQFSGFVVDKKGVLLSTAHDLDNVKDVSVILADGRKLAGRLVKRDSQRDLALIRVDYRFSSSVNVQEGRKLLKAGERIYASTCSQGERTILSGLIAGVVKPSENLLLWRVDMETPVGSSGSPVFDREGKMVAMIKGRYRGVPSIGFLIPLETVAAFLNEK